MHNPLTYKFCV